MESAVRTSEAQAPRETPSLEIQYNNAMRQLETLMERSRGGDDDFILRGTQIDRLMDWIEQETAELIFQREQLAYLRREAAAEAGRFSSIPRETDVVPNEKTVLELLKIKNFDREERHGDEQEEVCSVCLEDLYGGAVGALDCCHEFHVKCITKWLVERKNCCPLCRATALHY